jgi:hypothetical protein
MTPRVLSLIPPMTQLNTPYPSTAYLTGFLRSRGIAAVQEDLALALVLRLFSPRGLQAIRAAPRRSRRRQRTPRVRRLPRRLRATTGRRSMPPWPSCRGAIRRSRTASPAVLPARGPALRRARRLRRSRGRRSAGLGLRRAGRAPTARATSPRSTSTTSPTCCARRSIRASSSCAMPNRWRRARPASSRWRRRWRRRRT